MSRAEGFSLSDLSFDLLRQICSYLDANNLAFLCVTCHKLKSAAESPELWCDIAHKRWHNLNASAFPTSHLCFGNLTPDNCITATSKSGRRSPDPKNPSSTPGVAWKALVAAGNGCDPPCLHHKLLRPQGDYVSALQPLRLPSMRGAGAGSRSAGDLLLALAGNEKLQVWRTRASFPSSIGTGPNSHASGGGNGNGNDNSSRPSGSRDGTQAHNRQGKRNIPGIRHNAAPVVNPPVLDAVHDLDGDAMVYSLAWVTAAPIGSEASGSGGVPCGDTKHQRVQSPASRGGGGRGETANGGFKAGDTGPGSPAPYPTHQASSSTPPVASTLNMASGSNGDLLLAAGTSRGVVHWYEYGERESCRQHGADAVLLPSDHHQAARPAVSPSAHEAVSTTPQLSAQLRLRHRTLCGGPYPLVDLHVLGGPAGGGVAGGAGGCLLAALQDATFAMVGAGPARNEVHLLDVGTQRHLAAVTDPFESHEFVCCCPAGGSNRASTSIRGSDCIGAGNLDPNVLLLGSVHGSFCRQCYELGLPSLCQHKHRSATAALSTLDVRCPRGGLTQRFGLNHRSLYPRLAAAREYYVFTSHAGTPLEVYDRRAMSAPLFSMSRLPRLHRPQAPAAAAAAAAGTSGAAWGLPGYGQMAGERGGGAMCGWGAGTAGDDGVVLEGDRGHEEQQDEGGGDREDVGGGMVRNEEAEQEEEEEEEEEEETTAPEGWCDGASAAPVEHQGLWLEASDDVLLGRAENGTLWLWDLSQALGWAGGPDRSGLWHWMYEHGPLPAVEEGYGGQDYERAAGVWSGAGDVTDGNDPWAGSGWPRCRTGRHVAACGGQVVCLGSVACPSSLPVCALAVGDPTALFSLGEGQGGTEYVVQSVVGPWSRGQGLDMCQVGVGFLPGC